MEKTNLRIFAAFLFFSFLHLNILGSTRVDSLKTLLVQKKGEAQFEILEQLADYYINNNLDSSFFFLSQLKTLATKTNNKKYQAIACSSIGLNHFYRGKYFDAEDCVKQAIDLQKQIGDTTNLADSYNVLAGIYGVSGQYSKSTKILFDAIKIYEAQNDLTGIVKAYNNLGYLFMKLENYEKAKEYYEKALIILDKNNIGYNRGFLYSNLGICHKEFGENDAALKNYRLALSEYKKNSTQNAIPLLFQSMGILYAFSFNNPDSAFFYFEKGIELAQEYDTNSLVELYRSLGKLYSKQNNLPQSIDAYKKSLEAAINNDDLNGQMQAHLHLSEANKTLNHFSTALNHYEKYTILKDSINNKETKKEIAHLNEKYENNKNKLLVKQLTIKQEHNRVVQIALISGIILLIITLAFILYGLVERKKRNRMEKSILKSEVQFKNKELASHALMMMQKNRMLQTLYDSISEAAKANTDELPRILNSLKMQIKSSFKSDKDWELFKLYFEQINKSFFKKLKEINPDLTQHDIRLAALIKLRFNIKEAASVLNLSPNSIKGARSRLRGKLGLAGSDDLSRFIEQIE
jgi:tetratricopeptide (TPR) repeat protein